ncbi:alpha/beta fold hydrolase [Streptomyces sp. NPDC058451]|uniref:alpha/beta fold hydrolase n=1 Tax=Streptomyces sp. NPDC058451 TaxID=3346506 RepID=UPI00365069EB
MSHDRPQPPDPAGDSACTVHRKRPTGGTRALLLHGLANSSSVWDALAAREAGGLDLWAAELPWGGGRSPAWAYGPHASRAVADALGQVPGGAGIVVAHSFSTVLLLELLGEELAWGGDPFARHGIEGLVLVSPFYRRDPESFEYGVVGDMLENFRRTMDEGIRVVAGPRLDPSLRRDMAQRVCEQVGPYGYLSFFRSYLHTPWLRTDLITVPSLVIGGEEDFTAVPAESRALAADLPDARCRFIPGAGHFPMVEQADAFSAALGEFLDAIGCPAPAAVDQPA